jgi:hypothetical protein
MSLRPKRITKEDTCMPTTRTKLAVAGSALALAGFGAGTVVAITGSASAAPDPVGAVRAMHPFDPAKSMRPDEHLVRGTTARKVAAAAKKEYPGAVIQRVETDSDGVYEAHIVTTSGKDVIVMVGEDFTVTGTRTSGEPGGLHGGGPFGPPPVTRGNPT